MLDQRLERRTERQTGGSIAPSTLIDQPELYVQREPLLPIFSVRLPRAAGANQEARQRLAQALGIRLPDLPNQVTGDEWASCAWIEPNAWLVIGRAAGMELPAGPWLITDVSHRSAGFRVRGPKARDLLSGAITLDLDAPAFVPGRCARTRFAEAAIVFIQQLTEQPDYRLLIDVSLSAFLSDWLIDAASLSLAQRVAGGDSVHR